MKCPLGSDVILVESKASGWFAQNGQKIVFRGVHQLRSESLNLNDDLVSLGCKYPNPITNLCYFICLVKAQLVMDALKKILYLYIYFDRRSCLPEALITQW